MFYLYSRPLSPVLTLLCCHGDTILGPFYILVSQILGVPEIFI